jgi:glycerol-3-phosphate dehydrogenase (NAD(P)+)
LSYFLRASVGLATARRKPTPLERCPSRLGCAARRSRATRSQVGETPPVTVTVIGAGAWGTTMASLLATRTSTVVWAREPEVVAGIEERHENPLFLPGAELTPTLRATTDLVAALTGAEVVFMATPSQHYRSVLEQAAEHIAPTVPFVSLTKGIEDGSLLRMSEVATSLLAGHDPRLVGVLSGPNIAKEVLAGHPTATTIALQDDDAARRVQALVMAPHLRVYTNPDVVGCEIGGAVKNVIALAAGMATGLGYGHNTLAAIVTRGLAELTRLGMSLGGDPLTFLGLAGMGDLVVTCHSGDSRNRHVGEELGRGRPLDEVIGSMRAVAEGVRSCGPVLALARRAGVELPICEQVGAVLDGSTSAEDAVRALLGRGAKPEMQGIVELGRGN